MKRCSFGGRIRTNRKSSSLKKRTPSPYYAYHHFDRNHPATPEAIRDRFQEICNLDGAVPLESGADTMRYVK
jgi:hypothetical protein